MAWCYLPDTASASVQAAADLTWVLALPSRALPPPVMSRSRTIPGARSSPDSAPDTCIRHRSGTISRHLTPDHGEDRSTRCSPDTHASRFPRRDRERARTIRATSGQTSVASSISCSRDGAFSRMSRDTSASALTPWSTTYADWVSALRLAYSRRAKQARRMSGNAFSSWPTASAALANGNTQVASDPTPGQTGGTTLSGAAEKIFRFPEEMWGTPRGSDGEKGGPNMSFGSGGTPLPAQAANWPTATTRDYKGSSSASLTRKDGKSRLDMLDFAAEQGFAHPDPLTWTPGKMSLPSIRMARRLYRSAISRLSPATLRRLSRRDSFRRRRLNAVFVEWLMGWPPGHALCGCSVTEYILWQRHMRGALSRLPMASGAWILESAPEVTAPQQMEMF